MRATMGSGRVRENKDTATIQMLSISTQSSSEPSCPPQTPEMRNSSGNLELEWLAT